MMGFSQQTNVEYKECIFSSHLYSGGILILTKKAWVKYKTLLIAGKENTPLIWQEGFSYDYNLNGESECLVFQCDMDLSAETNEIAKSWSN